MPVSVSRLNPFVTTLTTFTAFELRTTPRIRISPEREFGSQPSRPQTRTQLLSVGRPRADTECVPNGHIFSSVDHQNAQRLAVFIARRCRRTPNIRRCIFRVYATPPRDAMCVSVCVSKVCRRRARKIILSSPYMGTWVGSGWIVVRERTLVCALAFLCECQAHTRPAPAHTEVSAF